MRLGLRSAAGLASVCAVVVWIVPPVASAGGGPWQYTAAATVVVRADVVPPPYTTVVDAGGVVCMTGSDSGIGGACVPWGNGDSIAVSDDGLGSNIAFQVCIDNNGDNACTTGFQPGVTCRDYVAFSHGEGESFFNPIGPMPTGFTCGNGDGFPGYIVYICDGVHEPRSGTPHVHAATAGSIAGVTDGGPPLPAQAFGNFCGGDFERNPPIVKPYVVL